MSRRYKHPKLKYRSKREAGVLTLVSFVQEQGLTCPSTIETQDDMKAFSILQARENRSYPSSLNSNRAINSGPLV